MVSPLDWEIAERLGITLQAVTRLHPIERYHLWPARVAEIPSLHQEHLRTQGLLATLCAMLGSMFRGEGQPASTPWDFAPWLPRPKEDARPEGAGLVDMLAGAHERKRRGH